MGFGARVVVPAVEEERFIMTGERWQEIRTVLEAALQMDSEKRRAYLDQACASDQSLRREVESLLAADKQAQTDFLQSPPLAIRLGKGTRLGDYEIQSLLGAGGMGEVYRARDLRLRRDVAVKVLPAVVSSDPERLRRFEQEATAAAALNHPNILAVYQMGTHGGASYLVSELLEGETLREQIRRGRVAPRRVIDYGVQIAHGLAAAHEKGIVHRDLKPENLFVAKDGRIKILDFGLAKLTQAQAGSEPSAPTIGGETETGLVMGTIGYMSPEQVRGQAADFRADIFAFGAILYEMLTGKRAFQKPTSPETMSAILNEDPPEISSAAPRLSPSLQRIVRRCLEKNPERRFQSASDLAFALAALTDAPEIVDRALEKDRNSRNPYLALTACVVLPIAAFAAYHFWDRSNPVPFQNFSVNKVTETSKATLVTISPDGKYILNAVDDKGKQSLWLRTVPTNSDTQVMPPEPLQYLGLRFSPDGNYLYFVRGEPGQPLNDLYRAPVLGGTPQKLVTDVDTNITFSPDGRSLAYAVNNNPQIGGFRLVAYSLQTAEAKTLVTGPSNQLLLDPAWSPDGKTIVCVIRQAGDAYSGLVAIDPLTGKQNLFSQSKWGYLSKPAWLPNRKGLFVLSWDYETQFTRHRILEISYPGGIAIPVTHDISDYSDLSLSADGHTLATVLQQSHYQLFVAPSSALGSGQTEQLTSTAALNGFSWTPDGQVILIQDFRLPSGFNSYALSLFNVESRSKTPLTSPQQDGAPFLPSACANDRYVVFSLGGHGGASRNTIWRMDAGGGNLKQLSDGKNDAHAVCSPDGKWVYYMDLSNGTKLNRVPLGAGKAEKLCELPGYGAFDISPDGKLAVFAASRGPKTQLAQVPVDSPQNTKLVDLQRPISSNEAVRFSHDGKAVVYAVGDQDAENLWLQPLDGSPGKQITNFKSEQITDFHWSFDGSKLAMVRGHADSDVVLMEESKP
jgi:serine/threonine protein kinase